MPRVRRDKSHVHNHLHEFVHHETDLEYWLEHVVHWHALLFAVVAALSVGYFFFNQQPVLATQEDVEIFSDVQN